MTYRKCRRGNVRIFCNVADFPEFDIDYTGAHEDDDADASLHQMVWGQPSAGVVDGDNEQIVQCLEHIRRCDSSVPFFFVKRRVFYYV
jgi:hypothetical protein